jgi:hypothetical protein
MMPQARGSVLKVVELFGQRQGKTIDLSKTTTEFVVKANATH